MSRRDRRVVIAGTCAGAVLVFGGVVLFSSGSTSAGQDPAPVLAAVQDAIISQQQIGAVDAASASPGADVTATVAPGEYGRSDHPELARLTPAQVASAGEASETRLRRLFTGRQLAYELEVNARQSQSYRPLEGASAPSATSSGSPSAASSDDGNTNVYILDGGADRFRFTTVSMNGDQATVVGSAHTWLDDAVVEPSLTRVFHPSSIIDFTAQLTESPGGVWQVSDYTWTFAPGYEP